MRQLACLIVGVVLVHTLLMMSSPDALAESDAASAHAHSHQHSPANRNAYADADKRASVEVDHHCSPLTGDLKRFEFGWGVHQVAESAMRLEHGTPISVLAPLEPNPPDRSLFQVFRI